MFVLFLFNNNDQVSGLTSADTGISLSPHGNIISIGHTGGDIYFNFIFAFHPAFTIALAAFIPDHASFALTIGAWLNIHKLSEHRF